MSKTLRNQNKCADCGYTWFPRGKEVSLTCPKCRCAKVGVVPRSSESPVVGCLVILVVIIAAAVMIKRCASSEPSETKASGATISVPVGVTGAPAVGIAAPAGKAENSVSTTTEAPPHARQTTLPPVEVREVPAEPVGQAVGGQVPKDDPTERIYTDEEIELLESEKQYRGDDPIVRSRLGLPSRQTHKLVR